MLTNERQGRPHSDDVRSLVWTLSTAQTHLGQGEPFDISSKCNFKMLSISSKRVSHKTVRKSSRILKLNPNGGQTLTFPIAQIAKRPGIEGVKVAKVMSTCHTYPSALFNLNNGYELNNRLDIFKEQFI